MNILLNIRSNFFIFACTLFLVELLVGFVTLLVLVSFLNMESSWVLADGAFSFHFLQLIVRYIFLSPVLSWYFLKYVGKNIVQRVFLNILALALPVLFLGFMVPGVRRRITFDSDVAEGLSVWVEIVVTSIVVGVLFYKKSGKSSKRVRLD